jgi:hypothetical protein
METTTIHPFEKAGLGKAPFRYVGIIDQEMRYGEAVVRTKMNGHMIEFATKPGGSCDYCGTYIVTMCKVKSADGKFFKVGCDCIEKVADVKMVRAVKEDTKKMKKAREIARIARAFDRLEDPIVAERLAVLPHPRGFKDRYNGYPLSAANYVSWMRQNSMHAGRLETAKFIEKALA